jgi:zinc/manganese transport system substrate-binding protein
LLRQSGNAKIQQGQKGYLLATSLVDLIEVPVSVDRSQGDVHAAGNPHIHWDPYRVLKVAKELSIRLGEIDSAHLVYYQTRFIQFEQKMHQAMSAWHQEIQFLKGKKAIVYHKDWNYLLHWLGVDIVGDLEPKPGVPPTSSHLAALVQLAHQHRPDFIMVANYQDIKGAEWLSKKIAVPVMKLPYTIGGSEKATDLISLYASVLSILSNHSRLSNLHAQ